MSETKVQPTTETTEPTHYHARGWKGDEPGSCGVECACGLGYDGFDSLGEAAALLDRHIADETGTEPVERPTKPASELRPGDQIWHDGTIREVRHVEPYNDDAHYLVVCAGGHRFDVAADETIAVATDAEIAEAKDVYRRRAVANALHDLADAIVAKGLPAPKYRVAVGGCVDTQAEVQRWADHLGVEIRRGGVDGSIPVAAGELPAGEDLVLYVSFQGHAFDSEAGA